eukprot:1930993-Amphidinium_carterae.1
MSGKIPLCTISSVSFSSELKHDHLLLGNKFSIIIADSENTARMDSITKVATSNLFPCCIYVHLNVVGKLSFVAGGTTDSRNVPYLICRCVRDR